MTLIDLAYKYRKIIEKAVESLDDATALEAKTLYPTWGKLVAEGRTVALGFRFYYEKQLFKTLQPEYTFTDTYIPGTQGTQSLFAVIDEVHKGTMDDPIPYNGNMELNEGFYYSQDGKTYICVRNTVNPVYHALKELTGIYVEEVK